MMKSFDRKRASTERGAGRFFVILLLAFAAAIVYVVVVYVPIYQGNQAMQVATAEIIHRGALQDLKDDDLRAQLKEKARECGLPDDHRIELWHEGRALATRITYKHRVRFPFYTYEWPFAINIKDPGL
ncbi:MAG: hypothetical protein ACRD82_01365 [Blastocatellia bacterium]